jgi:hypothetical protein
MNKFRNPQSEIRNRYGLDKRLEHDIKKLNFFKRIRHPDGPLLPGNLYLEIPFFPSPLIGEGEGGGD